MKVTFSDPIILILHAITSIYLYPPPSSRSSPTLIMDDWELLSDDDGLVDFYIHTHKSLNPNPSPRSNTFYHFDDDYFSPDPSIVPVPIHFNPTVPEDEVTKLPIESTVVPPEKEAIRALPEAGGDDNAASNNNNQVLFVKLKEADQFVDMKMDSIEDRSDAVSEAVEAKEAVAVGWEEEIGGANIWRRGFTGIGALCSFGVAAAATVCIIILGSHQKQQQSHNHKARFQIYATDKRIKQVVHQATRLNEVISGTRGGVQLARAHISYGGYYDSV